MRGQDGRGAGAGRLVIYGAWSLELYEGFGADELFEACGLCGIANCGLLGLVFGWLGLVGA